MPISPFLELDEERKKRDQLFQQKLGNVGSSLVSSPLTFQKLMQDSEDRRLKLDADRAKLMQDKEAHELDQTTGKQKNEIDAKKQNRTEMDKAVESQVGSGLSRQKGNGFELDDATSDRSIMNEAVDNPAMEDVSPQELEAALLEARNKKAKEKADFDLRKGALDIRQQDANTRSSRQASRAKGIKDGLLKPTRAIGVGETKSLLGKESTIDNLSKMLKYREQENIDTGPVAGLVMTLRNKLRMENPKQAMLMRGTQDAINEHLRTTSGLTVTPQEFERVAKIMPATYDEEEIYDLIMQMVLERSINDYNNEVSLYQKIRLKGSEGLIEKDPKTGVSKDVAAAKEAAPQTQGKETRRQKYERLRGSGMSHDQAMAQARGG